VGIQSFNSGVTALINRSQRVEKIIENLRFLNETGVHLHTDLIIGLPSEDITSFAQGFDQLIELGVEEIQVGILKRLRGAPIALHTKKWEVIYSPDPPYEILQNKLLTFETLMRLKRFARYWNIVGNSGRFTSILAYFKKEASPFESFFHFSDWLFENCGRTHKISYQNMLRYLLKYWVHQGQSQEEISIVLCNDYARTTGKANPPRFLTEAKPQRLNQSGNKRQQRHLI
jgi:hypothetical protein